jgi:hypothetical protein
MDVYGMHVMMNIIYANYSHWLFYSAFFYISYVYYDISKYVYVVVLINTPIKKKSQFDSFSSLVKRT